MPNLPHDPPPDYADQLLAAILEAEAHAEVNGTREARFYAMGLRTAAGLYGMAEGFAPETRARRLADLERAGFVPAFTPDGAPNPAAVGTVLATVVATCGATNHQPCAVNGGRGPSLLGGQHSCAMPPHNDARHRCACGHRFVQCVCSECEAGHA